MKKFAKIYESKKYGQILIRMLESEMVEFSFYNEETECYDGGELSPERKTTEELFDEITFNEAENLAKELIEHVRKGDGR